MFFGVSISRDLTVESKIEVVTGTSSNGDHKGRKTIVAQPRTVIEDKVMHERTPFPLILIGHWFLCPDVLSATRVSPQNPATARNHASTETKADGFSFSSRGRETCGIGRGMKSAAAIATAAITTSQPLALDFISTAN